jgi:hypothetical protein
MAAAAHSPAFATKVGIPQKVARDFNQADQQLDDTLPMAASGPSEPAAAAKAKVRPTGRQYGLPPAPAKGGPPTKVRPNGRQYGLK